MTKLLKYFKGGNDKKENFDVTTPTLAGGPPAAGLPGSLCPPVTQLFVPRCHAAQQPLQQLQRSAACQLLLTLCMWPPAQPMHRAEAG